MTSAAGTHGPRFLGVRAVVVLALCCGLASGCGRSGEPAAGHSTPAVAAPTHAATPSPSRPPETSNAAGPALSVAFSLPRLVTAGVLSSRSMVVEAVYFATAQTGSANFGQITRTGTITATPFGYQYTPQPADRLVVQEGGRTHEFQAIEAMGDNSAMFATNWLMAPHRLNYVHRLAGEAEATVREEYDGRNFVAQVSGWAVLQGRRFTVELVSRGLTQGGSDSQGAETQTRSAVTGSIRGDDLAVDVNEQHTNLFVSAFSTRLLPSQRGSANQLVSTVANTLKFGGDTYRFQDVHVETGNREKGGQTVSAGVTAVSGVILRNDQRFAECSLQNGVPVAVTPRGVIPLATAAP